MLNPPEGVQSVQCEVKQAKVVPMEPQHGRSVDAATAIAFHSNAKAPYNILSNFHEVEVIRNGVSFPSSEHAFQAALSREGVRDFTSESKIGKLTPEACALVGFPKKKLKEKCDYWKKKENVGILAKKLIRKHKLRNSKREIDRAECESLFKEILLDKYTRNPHAKKVLLDTHDAYLYEFVRSSNARFQKTGEIERWGAMIVDGKLVGDNQMGALMMWVRDEIRKHEK